MGDMQPVAFDIETDGFEPTDVLTVAGFATPTNSTMVVNTDGASINADQVSAALPDTACQVKVIAASNEEELLDRVRNVAETALSGDKYLCAFNGETWNGGFDLPFLRTACITNDVDWVFPDTAYVDVFELIDSLNTNGASDLCTVYASLIGDCGYDPFDDSEEAVAAFNNHDFGVLLRHNLADIRRTLELIELASDYVPQSDFSMKNLSPPNAESTYAKH